MFCSDCGRELTGKFCSNCGKAAEAAPAPPVDWSRETVYDKLVAQQEVRELLRRHAALATKATSGEQWLELFDKVASLPVPLTKLVPVAASLTARWGAKTGKQRTETLASPVGRGIVAALCSLARHGQALKQVHQLDDGCLIEAMLPSDLWAFAGTLSVSVRRLGTGCRVDVGTAIPGQMFDWGKSKRCIDALLADLARTP